MPWIGWNQCKSHSFARVCYFIHVSPSTAKTTKTLSFKSECDQWACQKSDPQMPKSEWIRFVWNTNNLFCCSLHHWKSVTKVELITCFRKFWNYEFTNLFVTSKNEFKVLHYPKFNLYGPKMTAKRGLEKRFWIPPCAKWFFFTSSKWPKLQIQKQKLYSLCMVEFQ